MISLNLKPENLILFNLITSNLFLESCTQVDVTKKFWINPTERLGDGERNILCYDYMNHITGIMFLRKSKAAHHT